MADSLSCSLSSVEPSSYFVHPSTPFCKNMSKLPSAAAERARLSSGKKLEPTPLFIHLSHGLAYTTGSALGSHPPTLEQCLSAFTLPNQVGLTAGARAWTKHSHRSLPATTSDSESQSASAGWWGTPSGPVATINERALSLYWKVMNGATWRNLHWLPHQVLVYEVRVAEGYGMRWSQNQHDVDSENKIDSDALGESPWIFRGFVEPMMENGHEVGWRHGS